MVYTGKDTGLVYKWEDTFAQDTSDNEISDDWYKTFGSNVTMGTNEGSNNAVRQFKPRSRKAEHIIEQQFAGSWSVDFTLTNPWFLQAIYGPPNQSDVTSGEFWSYDFSGEHPTPMRLYQPTDMNSNVTHRVYKGCVATSIEISTSVEDVVQVSINGAYADEELIKNADESISQPNTRYRPLHFAHSDVYFDRDDGRERFKLTQDVSLSLEANVEILYELGTRKGVDFSAKQLEPSMSYTNIMRNDEELKNMYGVGSNAESPFSPSDPDMDGHDAKIILEFTNGKSEPDKNILTFNINGTLPDTYSRNNVGDPTADIEEDIDRLALGVDATAENDKNLNPDQ